MKEKLTEEEKTKVREYSAGLIAYMLQLEGRRRKRTEEYFLFLLTRTAEKIKNE